MEPYDELRDVLGKTVEYRYADYPLPLGESIMLNHALFAGMLLKGATPVTDDSFHKAVLDLKLKRAWRVPQIAQALEDKTRRRGFASAELAVSALTDQLLQLPALSTRLPIEEVVEYRLKHSDNLAAARRELALMAQRIRSDPWSPEFAADIEHQVIPDLDQALKVVRATQVSWFKSKKGSLALRAAGLTAATAATVVSLVAAPVIAPAALAVGALNLVSASAVPGAEIVRDWLSSNDASGNDLAYLIRPIE
jgi:hypothetical protein